MKKLVEELDSIFELLEINYRELSQTITDRKQARLHLQGIKNQVIRGQVIKDYTWIDEWLNMEIRDYLFPRGEPKNIRRTKKFQNIEHYLLQELYPLQKLRFVTKFTKIPKPIVEIVNKVNILRNGLAHAFYPEEFIKSKPEYKGKNIFELEGLRFYMEDMWKVKNYVYKRWYS